MRRQMIMKSFSTGYLFLISAYLFTAASSDVVLKQDAIFKKYKPIAVEESMETPRLEYTLAPPLPTLYRREPHLLETVSSRKMKSAELVDIPTLDAEKPISGNLKVSESVFSVPETMTTSVTKLITGKQPVTFMDHNISKPKIEVTKGKKVIATYSIMVPIFIPAMRKKSSPRVLMKQNPVKFVEESKVEMVPVTKEVSHRERVLKAEPVPQKVITDFIKAGNKKEVIKSIVQNFD